MAARSPAPRPTAHQFQALPSHIILAAATQLGLDSASAKYHKPVFLVPFSGPGRRRFVGRLGAGRVGTARGQAVFLLKAKGFGLGLLVGKDIPQYASDSVALSFAHLAAKYNDDTDYLAALVQIASDLSDAYFARVISGLNQERIAFATVKKRLPSP